MTVNDKRGPRTRTIAGSLLAALLLITACTSTKPGRATAPPTAKTPATDGDLLAGAAWYVRHISVGGRTTIAPPPTAAWIEFGHGNTAEGNYGCSPFKAAATVTETAVTVGEKTDGAPPAKQCPASNLAFEGKLRKIFSGPLTISRPVDDLTMDLTNQRGDYVALQLLRPKGLFGSRWQLTDLIAADDGGRAPVIGGTAVYYVFHRDGTVTGNLGCNDFTGRAAFDRNVLTMYRPVLTTHRTCSRELMDQERTLLTYRTNPRRMQYSATTRSFEATEIGPPPMNSGYHWAAIPDN